MYYLLYVFMIVIGCIGQEQRKWCYLVDRLSEELSC